MHVSLEYPASGEKQDLLDLVFVQNSGHVDDDIHMSALDVEMDERVVSIKSVLDWYREDARDLRRSELNDFAGSVTCLNAFEGKIWQHEKRWKSEKNIVTHEEFVKNSEMNAKNDPKVVMVQSIYKIGGWNNLQPSNQHLLEQFMDENEPWLLIAIPNRDPILVTQDLARHCEF